MPVVRAHRDGVRPERGARGPRRGVAVVRSRMPHHVFERDLGLALALELVDSVDGGERATDVAGDGIEDLELLVEPAIAGRALDVEDADDLAAGPERHDDGLARLRIAAAESVVVDRPPEDDLLALARDPAGDPLVDRLSVSERNPKADRRADPELLALDEHDRRPARADAPRDLLRGARQEGRGVTSLLESGEQPLEQGDAVRLAQAVVAGGGPRASLAEAHPPGGPRGGRRAR